MLSAFFPFPLRAQGYTDTVPLTLEQYVDQALSSSLRSRTAEENLASNRLGWVATHRSLTWPSLTASANERKAFSDSDTGTEVDTRAREGRLALSQPLLTGTSLSVAGAWNRTKVETDVFGTVTPSLSKTVPTVTAGFTQPIFIFTGNESLRTRRESNLNWSNQRDQYIIDRLNIEFDARALYYELLLQSETMEVQRRKFESAKLVNDTTRALVRAGKLAEVELVRADIRSRSDQRQIQNAESNLEKVMNRATDFISLASDKKIEMRSKLRHEPFLVPLDFLLKLAAENNPDLQSSRRAVELSEISLKRTREGDRPTLSTSGTYELTQDRSDDVVPLDPYGWNVQVGVEWPIFDATQTRLRTQQGKIALQNTKRSYENAQRDLSVRVENAYLEVKRAEEQIADFASQKEAAQRNVSAIRLQYRNGLTRLTDVFDAENQMRDLDLEYLNLLVSFNTARDRIKLLVGVDPEKLYRTKQ